MKRILLALIVVTSLVLACVPAFAAVTTTERTIFLFVNNGMLGMWERVSYENPNGESLTIMLPKGAEQIQGGSAKGELTFKQEDLKETPDGIEVTVPLPKGNDVLELSYFAKPTGNIFDYTAKLITAPKKLIFMSGGDIAVTGPQIGQGSQKQSGDNKFVEFPVVAALKSGDVVQAKMDIYPGSLDPKQAQQQPAQEQQPEATTQQQAGQEQVGGALSQPYNPEFHNPGHIRLWNTSAFKKIDPHLFTALIVLIPVALIAFYVIQRRKEKMLQTVDVEELAFQKILAKQKDLIHKIAELDDRFAAREIEEEEYTTLRENYKHRLLQIKSHLLKHSE